MRVLALDVGTRRIGLALSDELGLTAQGLETLTRTNVREDLGRLARLIEERGVTTVLVGEPLLLTGQAGRQSEYVHHFARRLEQRTGVPVQFWDERLTSVEAGRRLREGGVDRRLNPGAVDRVAAVLLLESYLGSMQAGE